MYNKSLFILVAIFFSSCTYFTKEEVVAEVAAKVGTYTLTVEDLKKLDIKDVSPEDSLVLVNNFVENWVKEKLMLQKAELNLTQYQKDFNRQLEDYRKTLLIYTYELELIKQNLDTNVSESDIQDYYQKNPENFYLTNDIAKINFLKVPINAPKTNRIKKLFLSEKEKDQHELKEYAHQYAEKFYFDENEWIELNELRKEAPISILSTDFFKQNNHIITEDSLALYFILFKDYRLKGDVSPLSFESDNIKNIILNKRKLNLLKKIKIELYQQALLNKEIQIYSNHIENQRIK
ncbi:MAG: hypothetical protein COW67_13650 [Flavobacteriales bacterium CG18_big_fil_WC_8_21_14_2_50_32_9]|nr:MAG: hypothetical protein COW67_13650 [Flavobacteriales bacterium CG18_big_fil_WC_8_21_14_2_50_32_9]PJC62202.1 MAG: hypothetical protein CO022_05780 [Flavobacteriales bacterium CG_4_9_14_0_2_um_filter_32_27]